ncbi:oligosaccharide flippase family protein [Falsiroseomonas oryzae]|uniref:oligosaccharide flippase family protein n=1 Tax=Falsiroseomonas oryzae TaxID=2766473 RepID=UPI0022EB33DF|nr:oligosaccharide flippase family protein [Roseomonas sp. MO-31]
MAETAPQSGILTRTAMGAGWMFAWRMAARLLGLASTLIMVRLLSPEDFGLFSLAFAIIATLDNVLAVGVEAQVVRAHKTDRELYDNVFTIAVIRGVALSLAMLATAAPLAAFFEEPRLEAVIQVLSLMPLLAGFTNVGAMEFQRNLEFNRVFVMHLVPRLLHVPITLVLAAIIQSYWALIIGAVLARIFGVGITYVMHPFRPRLSLSLWRSLIGLSFWSWIIAVGLALRDRTATFAMGRMLGTRELGIYTVSYEIAALPASELANPIQQAAFPGMAASLRSPDRDRITDAFLRIFSLTMLVCLPISIGLSLMAGPVVSLLLGQGWLEAYALIAILAIGKAAMPFGMIGQSLLDAQTRLREIAAYIYIGMLFRFVAVGLLVAGFGLHVFAVGMAGAMIGEAVVMTLWCLYRLRLRPGRLARVTWRPLVAVCAMALVLWSLGLGWAGVPPSPLAGIVEALKAVPVGAAVYLATLGLCWWLSGRPAGAETDMLAFARMMAARLARALPFTARYLAPR